MDEKLQVLVFERHRENLKFLSRFFERHPLYRCQFVPDARALRKLLRGKTPYLLIAGCSLLDRAKAAEPPCPVIFTVNRVPEDMRAVARLKAENYVISPLIREDLEYKLELASRKRSALEAIRRDKKHLETLLDLTYLVSSSLDPDEILYFIVRKLSEIIPLTRCSMLSLAPDGGGHVTVVSTFEDPSVKNLRLDLRKYPEIKKAIRTRSAVVVRDAMRDPLMRAVRPEIAPIGIRSIVVVPVFFRNEVIGTLFLRTSRTGHVFTEGEVKLCQSIANASASALNNAFLFEKLKAERARLESLSITDFLTGVYNTRYFYHRLEDEFSRAQRYRLPLSSIMMDIDHFKRVNDTHGHRTGDMVLKEFATVIKSRTRKSDVFARYGGEEFILLLPQTAAKGAVSESQRLARVIARHAFKDLKAGQRIAFSAGIACYPHKKIKTQDDLIRLADDALLRAKEAGRNRHVVYK